MDRYHTFTIWFKLSSQHSDKSGFPGSCNIKTIFKLWVKRRAKPFVTVKPGQAYPPPSPPPPRTINELVIQKLNPLLVVDFRLISAFLHVQ